LRCRRDRAAFFRVARQKHPLLPATHLTGQVRLGALDFIPFKRGFMDEQPIAAACLLARIARGQPI